jgi:hypothetical protein
LNLIFHYFNISGKKMTEPYHQKTIELDGGISGAKIIEAMKALAHDWSSGAPTVDFPPVTYREQILTCESQLRTAGFSSRDGDYHVVILTGENLDTPQFEPGGIYPRIAVGTYLESWGGTVWARYSSQEDVETAVNRIAADLESRLTAQG